jgi:hypothetical protein
VDDRPASRRYIAKGRGEVGAKHLEIYRRREGLQMVTKPAQSLQTLLNIEKSRLTPHRFASDPFDHRESETRSRASF